MRAAGHVLGLAAIMVLMDMLVAATVYGPEKKDFWTKGFKTVRVWSPMVNQPVALRYAWATSPMGNLKIRGDQDIPLASFRTDEWDLPESEDPNEGLITREFAAERKADAQQRLEFRRMEEARRAVEILERLKTLGQASNETETGDEAE